MNNEEKEKEKDKAETPHDANTEPVKIAGVAYSGGMIKQWWSSCPMVVALDGMEFAPQIPLMNSHGDGLLDRLGEVKARIENNTLVIEGVITANDDCAKTIVEQGKLAKWQLSIGASVSEKKFIDPETKAVVNGAEYSGPFYIISKSVLREVSVVSIGADKDTQLTIAASFNLADGVQFNGEFIMDTSNTPTKAADTTEVKASAPILQNPATEQKHDTTVQANVDADQIRLAERARISEIRDVCAGEYPEIEARAIAGELTIDEVRRQILDSIRAKRPATSVNVNAKAPVKSTADVIECALAIRAGVPAEKTGFDEKTIELGMKGADISLKELCKEVIRMNGGIPSMYGFDNSDIRAAFSTVTLPTILSNVANKVMLKEYASYGQIAPSLCTEGTLVDFKENDRVRLVDVGGLSKVGADGEIKHGTLDEDTAKNKVDTYAKSLVLTRQMIINDDLGAFAQIPSAMGKKAARLPDKLFFSRLQSNPTLGDGKALFHSDHSNLLTGSSSVLSKTSLGSAVSLFRKQTDKEGEPIAVNPYILLVPPALEATANELVSSITIVATGSTDKVLPSLNYLANLHLKVVVSPWLSSDTAWYLFGNPAEIDTFEIGYLKGKKTPTIEQGETDFNTLGMWFRVYFDCGVREQDFRGMVKANGSN